MVTKLGRLWSAVLALQSCKELAEDSLGRLPPSSRCGDVPCRWGVTMSASIGVGEVGRDSVPGRDSGRFHSGSPASPRSTSRSDSTSEPGAERGCVVKTERVSWSSSSDSSRSFHPSVSLRRLPAAASGTAPPRTAAMATNGVTHAPPPPPLPTPSPQRRDESAPGRDERSPRRCESHQPAEADEAKSRVATAQKEAEATHAAAHAMVPATAPDPVLATAAAIAAPSVAVAATPRAPGAPL